MKREHRGFEARIWPAEVRIERRGEDEAPVGVGHAAVFDKLSVDLGGFREKIDPGTFKDAIKEDDVRALFNHDENHVLGRNVVAKTLRMAEDKEGLAVEVDMPDTTIGRDVVTLIERGDVSGMSFGFRTVKDEWEHGEDGEPDIRTLKKVRLFDVSFVTFPAYPDTDAAVRAYAAWRQEIQEQMEDEHADIATVPASIRARQLQLRS